MAPAESFAKCWLPWSVVENIVSRARYKSEALKTFQKCTSVVQNKVKPRNHIKHINHNHSILIVSNQKVRNKLCIKIYLSLSWEWLLGECFICRPENVKHSLSWKQSMEERLKFWINEQIEDLTIMTGQSVFHGLTKREELLLKNYLLEIPISSRRPIPSLKYPGRSEHFRLINASVYVGFMSCYVSLFVRFLQRDISLPMKGI